MTEYVYQVIPAIGGVPWTYTRSWASDGDARIYGYQLALQFVGVKWFLGLAIYRMDRPQGTRITTVFLEPPTARFAE